MNDIPIEKKLQQEEAQFAYDAFINSGGKPKVYNNRNELISGGKDDRPTKKLSPLIDGRNRGLAQMNYRR